MSRNDEIISHSKCPPSQGGGNDKEAKNHKAWKSEKIIESPCPSVPEKAEIEVHEADELYKEIRIENELEDEHGKKTKLKEDTNVDITVEAEMKATTPDTEKKS